MTNSCIFRWTRKTVYWTKLSILLRLLLHLWSISLFGWFLAVFYKYQRIVNDCGDSRGTSLARWESETRGHWSPILSPSETADAPFTILGTINYSFLFYFLLFFGFRIIRVWWKCVQDLNLFDIDFCDAVMTSHSHMYVYVYWKWIMHIYIFTYQYDIYINMEAGVFDSKLFYSVLTLYLALADVK